MEKNEIVQMSFGYNLTIIKSEIQKEDVQKWLHSALPTQVLSILSFDFWLTVFRKINMHVCSQETRQANIELRIEARRNLVNHQSKIFT